MVWFAGENSDHNNFLFWRRGGECIYNKNIFFNTHSNFHMKTTVNILPNISKGKGNQAMKFGQLLEYNMKIIFLEKLSTKLDGETNPRPFSGKFRLRWINSLNIYTVCFYCIPSWGVSKYIEIKLQTTCFYLILNIFKKQKEVWN